MAWDNGPRCSAFRFQLWRFLITSIARLFALSIVLTSSASASILPGFRLEVIGEVKGFLSCVVEGPRGELFYSSTGGEIYRLDGSESVLIAKVDTANEGNAALLGIAFLDSTTLVAHYVTPDLKADVLSTIDVATGAVKELATFPCDPGGSPCSTEHHGGNPIVAPDGTIFVAIGDYGVGVPAQNPNSFGGKILRVARDGSTTVHSFGFRNVFDFALDPRSGRLVVGDNGPEGNDEINLVSQGDNAGWPFGMGTIPAGDGTLAPVYTYPETVAPTGVALLRTNRVLRERGLLVGLFVPAALSYFPSIDAIATEPPIEIFAGEILPTIDVIEREDGSIIVADPLFIYRLHFPIAGDANGDGAVNVADFDALARELTDGDGNLAIRAQDGTFRGSWGADANEDGFIDSRDLIALANRMVTRRRTSRSASPSP